MKLIFVTNNQPWSIFIRWFTLSKYSHVALAYRTIIIEATLRHGVRLGSLKEFMAKYKTYEVCEVPNLNAEKAWGFAIKQLGKPYDLKAVFGLFFRRNWTDAKAWFCSELAAVALHEGGVTVIRKSADRVTPEDLLNSPLIKPIQKG